MKQSKSTGGTLGGQGLPIGIPAPKFEDVPEVARSFFEIGMKDVLKYIKCLV